jgi:hypothetical protein
VLFGVMEALGISHQPFSFVSCLISCRREVLLLYKVSWFL